MDKPIARIDMWEERRLILTECIISAENITWFSALLHLNVPYGLSEQDFLSPQRQFLCSCRWYLRHRLPYHSPPR